MGEAFGDCGGVAAEAGGAVEEGEGSGGAFDTRTEDVEDGLEEDGDVVGVAHGGAYEDRESKAEDPSSVAAEPATPSPPERGEGEIRGEVRS